MASGPRTRQELYDRIRSSSKDEVVLEEMVRLGFWLAEEPMARDPAEEVRRRSELVRELTALRSDQSRIANIEALKKELHRRRLEESKRKQKETKERKEREREERASAWRERKTREILFLGHGVSGGLSPKLARGNAERLHAQGLPVLQTAAEIATALGITVGELRFLTFARTTSTKTHYTRFQIPKKAGGTRLISAPMPRLKKAQRWVLDSIFSKVALHDAAHGFRAKRSIVSNAAPHVGSSVVVNVDLKDFFPTVSQRRVKGLFRALGYGEAAATIFSLLCSEPETSEVELDGRTYFVGSGVRHLPQGAPTSPAITNVLCRRLDRRLSGAAAKLGFVYTRYADDLSFSSKAHLPADRSPAPDVGKLLKQVRWVVQNEGFVPHPQKTRVLRRGRRQEVTGIVVNDALAVDRRALRKFRAFLFQLDKDGPAGKSWGPAADVFASAIGFATYVAMVDRERGHALLAQVRAIASKYGYVPKPRAPNVSKADAPEPDASKPEAPRKPDAPKKKWWKIF